MAKPKKSLTREMFLETLVIKPTKVELDGVTLYLKPISELKRSQRAAMMITKAGEIDKKYMERRRLYSLIDHLCDENGEPLFTEKDISSLQELDSIQIDPYFKAVMQFTGEDQGNE